MHVDRGVGCAPPAPNPGWTARWDAEIDSPRCGSSDKRQTHPPGRKRPRGYARARVIRPVVLLSIRRPRRRSPKEDLCTYDRLWRLTAVPPLPLSFYARPDCISVIEQSPQQGWRLLALDTRDATTPHGEAMQAIAAVFARLEQRLMSDRTEDALAAARQRGVQLGWPSLVPEDVAQEIMRLYRRRRMSARAIARHLTEKRVPAPTRGVRDGTAQLWRGSSPVHRILQFRWRMLVS